MSERTSVGILGGTFDPVHLGHLQVAETILERLGLSRVVLMLSARPPHKEIDDLSPAGHRLAMLELAVRGRPGLEVGRFEHEREAVSYTIDTLRALREGSPPIDPVFILGMDALVEIPTWRDYEELLEEFDLLVVDRSGLLGEKTELPAELERRLCSIDGLSPGPGAGGRILRLALEPIPISSSKIRSRGAAGQSLDGLVTDPVAGYILAHGLYREEKSPRQPDARDHRSPQDTPTMTTRPISPELASCIEAAQEKKAEDLLVLDLHGLSDVTDYFVICHGNSDRQVAAIADSIEERLVRELDCRPSSVEGRRAADWILMDYIDFVVHVFLEEKREFYRLDRLWGDAPRVETAPQGSSSAGA